MVDPLKTILGALTTMILAITTAPAHAEIPSGFDVPSVANDYRVSYSLTTGVWSGEQASLHHRLGLQFPLWGASGGAQLSFTNLAGQIDDSAMGNLRLYLQYFNSFSWARRANITFGGGLDFYVPTGASFVEQDPRATLVASPAAGDASLSAPNLTFGLRPRLHLAAEAWIFSLQLVGGALVHFQGEETRAAFEWGANFSVHAADWLALVVEGTGVSWLGTSPGWTAQRVVNLAAGIRFILPRGVQTGLWLRAPVTGREADDWGERLFIGVDVAWQR